MSNWTSIFSTGKCRKCRKKDDLRRGVCYPCSRPESVRQICRVGIGWGSSNALLYITKKAKSKGKKGRAIRNILTFVHPRLMENIKVDDGGTLRPIDKRYVWIRRNGWLKKSK